MLYKSVHKIINAEFQALSHHHKPKLCMLRGKKPKKKLISYIKDNISQEINIILKLKRLRFLY